MRILIFDRKEKDAKKLSEFLKKRDKNDSVLPFCDREDLEGYAKQHIFQVVFVFISDPKEDILLSERLLSVIPGVNLILVCNDERYMAEALRLHASGYIVLPVTKEKAERELNNLLYPVSAVLPRVRVVKNDNISIFIDDVPVRFRYEKTRELFLLLLEANGAMVSTGSMKERLWAGEKQSERRGSYLQNLRSDLIHSLGQYGMEEAVCHNRGRMWLDKRRFTEDKEE